MLCVVGWDSHGWVWIGMDWVLVCLVVAPPCGYWIKSSMTDRSGNDGRVSPLSLWIADQARNDVTSCPAGPALWIPSYAGMTVRDVGYDGMG